MAQFEKTNCTVTARNAMSAFMLLCFFIISFSPLQLFAEKPYQYRALPKSGTHLIAKTLYLLTGRVYGASHFINYDKLVHIPKNERTIVNIRDLRDFFVAHMENCDKGARNILMGKGFHREQLKYRHIHENWLRMSVEDKLSALINLQDELLPYPADCILNNIITADSLISDYEHGCREILVTHFENLVGPHGGGTRESQLSELREITDFCGLNKSNEELESIASILWGKAGVDLLDSEFNKGTVGRWKDVFSEQNIEEFKLLWNNYLVHWGYERDDLWY